MRYELYIRISPKDDEMREAFWKAFENDEKFKGDAMMHLYKGDKPREFDQVFMIRKLDRDEIEHIKAFIRDISIEWNVRVRTVEKESWMTDEMYTLLQELSAFTGRESLIC